MTKYVMAIDQGTTSTRAILFDYEGNAISTAQREVPNIFPNEGWVEISPLKVWISVVDVINEVLINANTDMAHIDSIGITNQRETAIIWEKETGLPVYNGVVWQSRQSVDICESLEEYREIIHQKSGLLINPYFSASKIRWILDHIPNGQERAEAGELMFGTVDTWVIYKLTQGRTFATDVTNASRTMLFNIFDLKWDDELLRIFNVPKCMLPEVKASSDDYGEASYFPGNVHIFADAGDQHASLFGHNCFNAGDSKNTYGTGCFMLMNTGTKPILSKNGLLTTVAWKIKDQVVYALEGSVFVGGASIQWLRDGLQVIEKASESEKYATKVEDSEGVYFVPAFVGLGTPYWDDDVRGSMFGITRATTKNHIIRATLEAIAYQTRDVFEVMKKEAGIEINSLRVDGGATQNNFLMQFQSDILQLEVKKPKCLETTALGAAYLAGLYSGYWKDTWDIRSKHQYQAKFNPKMDKEVAAKKLKGWDLAVKCAINFKPRKEK